ncbi:hypothetical protein B9T11_00850 [Wohlfahrtiimonas chitiniclastica]|nr:hypothetical protein B9T11_00850 [Wohlfahrtiimonas chitiniclastica]OYQ86444.1 hypothetical protein B9T15_02830 [Wohlfahrtiimonas chitiniclastica]
MTKATKKIRMKTLKKIMSVEGKLCGVMVFAANGRTPLRLLAHNMTFIYILHDMALFFLKNYIMQGTSYFLSII